MPNQEAWRDRRLARLRSHGLVPGRGRPRDPLGVARRMVVIQAQHPPAVPLAVHARAPAVGQAEVGQALAEHALVKTWSLRGTLHLSAAEDVAWIVRLVGPGLIRRGRRRLAGLGVDEAGEERAVRTITAALEGGPVSREELREHLRRDGFDMDSDRQTAIHLIQRTALRGSIVFAHDGDAFALAADVLPPDAGPEEDAAVRELVRRYQLGHAPATVDDFIAWSGLPAPTVRPLWREPRAVKPPRLGGPVASLLPHFDSYLLGYADRSLVLDDRDARSVQRGGGWLHPLVLVDGRVVGTWRSQGRSSSVAVSLFSELDSESEDALNAEIAEIERFLATDKARSTVQQGRLGR